MVASGKCVEPMMSIWGQRAGSANPMTRSTGDLLCPPTLEGGRLHMCCSVLHSTTAVLPSVHVV